MIRYVPYVWRSVTRNRVRSVLTVAGVAVGVLIEETDIIQCRPLQE